jgi:hypothetical protein
MKTQSINREIASDSVSQPAIGVACVFAIVGWGELGVRATPTITEKYVYEIGTFGDAFCFDRKTGSVVWKHAFKEVRRNHLDAGHGGAPAFAGKCIYIRGGENLYCIGEK